MDKTIKIEVPAGKAAQIEAEIERDLKEFDQIMRRIQKRRPAIDRLEAKTKATLAKIKASRQ